jgi:SnoaL-like domain
MLPRDGRNWADFACFAKLVIIGAMNAVERFFAASQAGDVEAAVDDVVMLNPATDDPIVGRDAVAATLRAVAAACDAFRHTHLLVDKSTGQTRLFGLVFEANVGDATLRGVDLIELDNTDRINTFQVAVRPIAALMALGATCSTRRRRPRSHRSIADPDGGRYDRARTVPATRERLGCALSA